ncbi:hypothetical protein TRIP_E30019 [uncultured Spirochaetota bacterium]|nr:hypothetical protein TRIP_E30019 [uncultured Spirochaetota bacterium]
MNIYVIFSYFSYARRVVRGKRHSFYTGMPYRFGLRYPKGLEQ